MTAPQRYGGTARYYPKNTATDNQSTPKANKGRPGTECAEPGCTELTRSTQGRCAQHRPMPTVRLHNGTWISIGPTQYPAHVARQIVDLVNDILDEAGL